MKKGRMNLPYLCTAISIACNSIYVWLANYPGSVSYISAVLGLKQLTSRERGERLRETDESRTWRVGK